MRYLFTHLDDAWALTLIHLRLSLIPIVLGLLIAVPLGALVQRTTRAAAADDRHRQHHLHDPVAGAVRGAAADHPDPHPRRGQRHRRADALHDGAAGAGGARGARRRAGAAVLDAATAVGYKPLTRMLKVELPLAIPVLIASLRVVAVTNISMVSVGSVIGIGGLGTWFTEGYQANKSDQIIAGIIAIFVLAIVVDTLIMFGGKAAHAVDPSDPRRQPRRSKRRRRALDELPAAGAVLHLHRGQLGRPRRAGRPHRRAPRSTRSSPCSSRR